MSSTAAEEACNNLKYRRPAKGRGLLDSALLHFFRCAKRNFPLKKTPFRDVVRPDHLRGAVSNYKSLLVHFPDISGYPFHSNHAEHSNTSRAVIGIDASLVPFIRIALFQI